MCACARPSSAQQVSLCFHGDDSHKLPLWLQQLGEQVPDIWFTDKSGNRSTNCLTLGIDNGG
jgi:hypothetical protein